MSKRVFHFDIRVKFSLFFTHTFLVVFCHETEAKFMGERRKNHNNEQFCFKKTKTFLSPGFLLASCRRLKIHSRRRKRNLTSSEKSVRQKDRAGKKRKMLLNIIEKTCCINDYFSSFPYRCCFTIYYYFRVQKDPAESRDTQTVQSLCEKKWRQSCNFHGLGYCFAFQTICVSALTIYADLIMAIYYFNGVLMLL